MPLRAEPLAQLHGVEVRQHAAEQLGRLVDVDDPVGLGEQRGRAHVGRQNLAVAVENIGPRGRHRVLRHDAPSQVAVGHRHEHDHPAGDHRIAEPEHQDGEPEARPGLGGTIDIAAIEQRAHERAAPRRLGGTWRPRHGRPRHRRPGGGHRLSAGLRNRHGIGCIDRGHLAAFGDGMLAVGASSKLPIGSAESGGTRSGGRSGR